MDRSWAHTTGILFLSLAFVGDLIPTDFELGHLSTIFHGTVGTGDGPTKSQACEKATQVAVEKTSVEQRSEISGKSCNCSQHASSVETWSCVASVSWSKP